MRLKLPRLREMRELRGWSQSVLSKEAGVSRDSISNYETGNREAYPSTAQKLADALGVTIADFMEDSPAPKAVLTSPLLEWALTASDEEFDRHIRDAPPAEVKDLLRLSNLVPPKGHADRGRILERVKKLVDRLQEFDAYWITDTTTEEGQTGQEAG